MKHLRNYLTTTTEMRKRLSNERAKRRTPRFATGSLSALFAFLAISASVVLMPGSFIWPVGNVSSALTRPGTLVRHNSASEDGRTRVSAKLQVASTPTSNLTDALSSSLSSYLSTLDPNVGVEVYDVTRQRFYTSHSTTQFLTASSIKVPIMLAFFGMTESQGREPDDDEMNLLTAMIEHSDNDAASALYNEINGAEGLANYLQQIGVSGLAPEDGTWGYSQITPKAMVDLLTHLQQGTILTADDRATALDLMQHIEVDQRWGVGDTAPDGATVSMKNGWVPGPDGLWSVNTSGIVTKGGETYIVSVYTREQSSLADGQAIVQRVCGAVASSLS